MKRKNTILILIFSTLAAIIAISLFIFILKVIENKNIHTYATLMTVQDKLKKIENLTIFAKKISEIKLLQDSINSRFVDPNKIDKFVGYLEEIGLITSSEISIKSIEVVPTSKNLISFNLSIKGTFDQVVKTITYLENIPYQVNFTRVYLNKDIKQISDIKQPVEKTVIKNTAGEISTWQADVSFNILSLN